MSMPPRPGPDAPRALRVIPGALPVPRPEPLGSDGMIYAAVTASDIAALTALLASTPGYFAACGGEPGVDAARAIIETRPPGVPAQAKRVRGLWGSVPQLPAAQSASHQELSSRGGVALAGGRLPGMGLFGVVDVVRGWPDASAAHIGLLLIREDQQGRGLGSALLARVDKEISRWAEIERTTISIVEANAQVAKHFWRAHGFTPTDHVSDYELPPVTSTARRWEKRIR